MLFRARPTAMTSMRSIPALALIISPFLIAPQLPAQRSDATVAGDSSTVPAASAPNPRAVQPERPTVATHAYAVAPGYVELELGVQEMQPAGISQFQLPAVLKIGLLPRTQLELQGGYARYGAAAPPSGLPVAAAGGAMDLAIALKQRLVDGAPILADFALQGAVKFPTGADGVGSGTTDLSLLLISSRLIGPAELDLNAGYTHRSGDGAAVPTSATLLTASLGTPIVGAVGGVLEVFGYPATSGPAGTATSVGLLLGPTLQLRPWLVLDAGGILNIRNMGANALYAGLTYNLGHLPGVAPPHRP